MLSYFIYTHIHRNSWTHKTLLFCFFFLSFPLHPILLLPSLFGPLLSFFSSSFLFLSLPLVLLPLPFFLLYFSHSFYFSFSLSVSYKCLHISIACHTFTGVKSCNLPSSLLAEEWIKTMQFIHMTKLFSILNMDEIILISGKWINHLSSCPSLVPFFCLLTI